MHDTPRMCNVAMYVSPAQSRSAPGALTQLGRNNPGSRGQGGTGPWHSQSLRTWLDNTHGHWRDAQRMLPEVLQVPMTCQWRIGAGECASLYDMT
jgi:hypothetical protein